MKKILSITSSASGEKSNSNKLVHEIIDKLTSTYPDSQLLTRDLGKEPLPHIEEFHLAGFFTPEDQHTTDHKEAIKNSTIAIKELMEADIIVIGVPLYNFGIPSTLKTWIDHVARAGITFKYSENGPEGLVKNKKVYLAIASGGVYTEGPRKSYDHAEPYLRSVLGVLGMTDITVFRIEGIGVPVIKDTAEIKALESVTEFVF
jgi:FMN-dependent NADH-azoreductase